MYIGRIVSVAMTNSGRLCVGYRVSSRSFPNRTALIGNRKVSILPKSGHESDIQKNPYIAYNCLRVVCDGEVAVMTNGSQTDPIAEKIDQGMPVRDALVLTCLMLDYEKDQYNTPRICAVADKVDNTGWLAVVREDGLEVQRMNLSPGSYFYVATYEENSLSATQTGIFNSEDAQSACTFFLQEGIFAERSNPVSSVCAMANETEFDMAVQDYQDV